MGKIRGTRSNDREGINEKREKGRKERQLQKPKGKTKAVRKEEREKREGRRGGGKRAQRHCILLLREGTPHGTRVQAKSLFCPLYIKERVSPEFLPHVVALACC